MSRKGAAPIKVHPYHSEKIHISYISSYSLKGHSQLAVPKCSNGTLGPGSKKVDFLGLSHALIVRYLLEVEIPMFMHFRISQSFRPFAAQFPDVGASFSSFLSYYHVSLNFKMSSRLLSILQFILLRQTQPCHARAAA